MLGEAARVRCWQDECFGGQHHGAHHVNLRALLCHGRALLELCTASSTRLEAVVFSLRGFFLRSLSLRLERLQTNHDPQLSAGRFLVNRWAYHRPDLTQTGRNLQRLPCPQPRLLCLICKICGSGSQPCSYVVSFVKWLFGPVYESSASQGGADETVLDASTLLEAAKHPA